MDMNVLENRLATFKDWLPDSIVSPAKVAKAGFHYIGKKTVECFSCHLQLSKWNYGENVLEKHAALSPKCEFVLSSPGSDEISIPEEIVDRNVDKAMEIEECRLATFSGWEFGHVVQPELLAKAGFFFLTHDHVKCPFCFGVIASWEPGDCPQREHLKYFPNCPFVVENIISKASHNT